MLVYVCTFYMFVAIGAGVAVVVAVVVAVAAVAVWHHSSSSSSSGGGSGRGGVTLFQKKQERAAREQRHKYEPRTGTTRYAGRPADLWLSICMFMLLILCGQVYRIREW